MSPSTETSSVRRWLGSRSLETAAPLVVLVLSLYALGGAARTVPFNGDEGNYLCTTTYFEYLFVQHDIGREEWRDNYWTHTQPMLVRYIAGAWLWFRGYDLPAMQPYCQFDWTLTGAENRALGYAPETPLVLDSRLPMVLVGALAVLGVYGAGRLVGGMSVGLIASGLTLASPLAQAYLPEVLPEGMLVLSMVGCLVVAMLGIRRGHDGHLPLGWAIGVGVIAGLGLAAKLTAVLSLVAFVVFSLLVSAQAIKKHRPARIGQAMSLAWSVSRAWIVAIAVASIVFVMSNPYLYTNPLRNTAVLFVSRAREMAEEQTEVPGFNPEWGLANTAVYSPVVRAERVLEFSLDEGTLSGSHRMPFEVGFSVIGLAVLIWRCWCAWRVGEPLGPEALLAVTVVTFFLGTIGGLLLAWPRYYLPTLVLGTLLSGLGIVCLVQLGVAGVNQWRTIGRLHGPEPLR